MSTHYNTTFPCLLADIYFFSPHPCTLNPLRPKLYTMKYNTDFWGLCFAWCYQVSDWDPKLLQVWIPLITCSSLHQTVQNLLVVTVLSFLSLKTPCFFSTPCWRILAGHFRSCFELRQIISFIGAECYACNRHRRFKGPFSFIPKPGQSRMALLNSAAIV